MKKFYLTRSFLKVKISTKINPQFAKPDKDETLVNGEGCLQDDGERGALGDGQGVGGGSCEDGGQQWSVSMIAIGSKSQIWDKSEKYNFLYPIPYEFWFILGTLSDVMFNIRQGSHFRLDQVWILTWEICCCRDAFANENT